MIVIGGSLGGSAAVGKILSGLPADFPLPVAVVLHRHRESDEMIVPLLQRQSRLPIFEAEDKEPIRPGTVFVCPADYHLLVEGDCFSLSTDDLVSFARPSIDVLFESAAEWRGPEVVAVILTGAGSDGTAGATTVAAHGGRVLVQNPRSAEGPWMPLSASAVRGAEVFELAEIARELSKLGPGPR